MTTLSENLAAFVLGELSVGDLPEVAVEALVEGLDSPHLARLAGETAATNAFVLSETFERALREVGLTWPTRLEAFELVKSYALKRVVDGRIGVREGTARIINGYRRVDHLLPAGKFVGDGAGVARLYALYHSFDELKAGDVEGETRLEQEIVRECRRLLLQEEGQGEGA